MLVNHQRIAALIIKHLDGKANWDERKELNEWLALSKDHQQVLDDYLNDGILIRELIEYNNIDKKLVWNDLRQRIPALQSIVVEEPSVPVDQFDKKSGTRRWVYFAAAALILAVSVFGVHSLFSPKPGNKRVAEEIPPHPAKGQGSPGLLKTDLAPGGNKAILTLADGTSVELNDLPMGLVARQGGTAIRKIGEDIISYTDSGTGKEKPLYNRISTPRGGWFRVTLPDGSTVRLNAASSLRFPASFGGKERNVELEEGEAYFEVTSLASKEGQEKIPLIVNVNKDDMRVIVSGTKFDVMAYAEDLFVKTTLVHGSVRLQSGRDHRLHSLHPGQQYVFNRNGTDTVLENPEIITTALAWEKGEFLFKDETIPNILQQLGRWYDADIVYRDTIPGIFTVSGSRKDSVSKLLDQLEKIKPMHFSVENKKITVSR